MHKDKKPAAKDSTPAVKPEAKPEAKEVDAVDYVVNVDSLNCGRVLTRVKRGKGIQPEAIKKLKDMVGDREKKKSLFDCLLEKKAIVTKKDFDTANAEAARAENAES
jgi:hypothetical protein